MSVNLDNVKAIVHNNKNVVKIENSHGIVWQAPPSGEWHEISLYSTGTSWKASSGSTSGSMLQTAAFPSDLPAGTYTCRVTYTVTFNPSSVSNPATHYYIADGTDTISTSNPPTNPHEFTISFGIGTVSQTDKIIGGRGYFSDQSTYEGIWLRYTYYNGAGTFYLRAQKYNASTSIVNRADVQLTITKLEVFY